MSELKFADPRQARIHRRLELVGAGPALHYRDACRLIASTAILESTSNYLHHLVREIDSAVRSVLLPVDFVGPEEGRHEAEIKKILATYGISDDDPIAAAWLGLRGRADDKGTAGRAHRSALEAPPPPDSELAKFFERFETVLDRVLEIFETRAFVESFEVLDELSAKETPTREDAKLIRNRVPNNVVTLGHFFDRIASPAWLDPLFKQGHFKHPPRPAAEGGGYLPWPASRYLVRMAAIRAAQDRVAEVALAIPDTENVFVHLDLIAIASAMPPSAAARLTQKIGRWYTGPGHFILDDKLADLISHLAKGAQTDAALFLATRLFRLRQTGDDTLDGGTAGSPSMPRRLSDIDEWTYARILERTVPDLVDRSGLSALALLCALTCDVLELLPHREDSGAADAYSYIWRPAIEDHQQNHPNDVRDHVITAARDGALRIVQREPARLRAVVEMLESQSGVIFRRMALHVLRVAGVQDASLVTHRVTDQALFESTTLWHEYILLVRDALPHLAPADQHRFFELVERGPDAEPWAAWRSKETGTPPTPHEMEQYRKHWQLRRLAPLREALPEGERRWHDQLAAELGSPEHPEFMSWSGGVVRGPSSPKSAADFQGLSVQNIIEFLATWTPNGDFRSPSLEGVGRELTIAVGEDPARFAAEASEFAALDPTYVRALLMGLREGLKQNKTFEWPPVLRLCESAMSHASGTPDQEASVSGRDPGWAWSRKAVADLLGEAFTVRPGMLPLSLRNDAWSLVEALSEDPDPTPESERRFDSQMSPFEVSINTTRSQAMHAVLHYALWIRRHVDADPAVDVHVRRGCDEMPEVRHVLDRGLDEEHESSLAVRAVYGHWIPWLHFFDSSWAATAVERIFPGDDASLWNAAWDGYIRFQDPYSDVFSLLRPMYRMAIDRLGEANVPRSQEADQRLTDHLMALYLRGTLTFGESDRLLERFYEKAPDNLRARAVWLLGRPPSPGEDIDPAMTARAQELWERRLAAARNNPAASREELGTFGWWFISGLFPAGWGLKNLCVVLELVGHAKPDSRITTILVEQVTTDALNTLRALRFLLEGASEPWRVLSWRQDIRLILQATIASNDAPVRVAASELINILAARGFPEFRDLLRLGRPERRPDKATNS